MEINFNSFLLLILNEHLLCTKYYGIHHEAFKIKSGVALPSDSYSQEWERRCTHRATMCFCYKRREQWREEEGEESRSLGGRVDYFMEMYV